MATTSSTLATGLAGGGHTKRDGLRVRLATGIVALGVLAGVAYGQAGRPGRSAGSPGHYPYVIRSADGASPYIPSDPDTTSDLGTEFDPYLLQGGQPR